MAADALAALRDTVLPVPHDGVLAAAAEDPVAAAAVGDDQVVARPRLDAVLAAPGTDHVVAVGSLDPLGFVAAEDLPPALSRTGLLRIDVDADGQSLARDVVVVADGGQAIDAGTREADSGVPGDVRLHGGVRAGDRGALTWLNRRP